MPVAWQALMRDVFFAGATHALTVSQDLMQDCTVEPPKRGAFAAEAPARLDELVSEVMAWARDPVRPRAAAVVPWD